MDLRCKLFGHAVTLDSRGRPELNDSGSAICERCGSHEYFDFGDWEPLARGILMPNTWYWYVRVWHPWVFNTWYWGLYNAQRSHENSPWMSHRYDDIPF